MKNHWLERRNRLVWAPTGFDGTDLTYEQIERHLLPKLKDYWRHQYAHFQTDYTTYRRALRAIQTAAE